MKIYGQLQSGQFYTAKEKVFNPSDPYAVATLHGGVLVGHVPQIISAICSAFIRGGIASYKVTGARQYRADLS